MPPAESVSYRVSVALCTYNGAAYLQEQLASIAGQHHPPWELIVCDDGSGDATAAIVETFAAAAAFPVHLHRNPVNLGSTRNFDQAIRLCTGDIIALSDQDDVWLPEKLTKLTAPFVADPQVGLVFSDAEIVSADLTPLGMNLWTFAQFTEERQRLFRAGRAFESQLAHNVVTGAAMAFRADLRPLVLPVPDDTHLIHDGWIALVAALVSRLVFLPERLLLYRQHPGQQLGVLNHARPRLLPRSHYLAHIRQLAAVCERLCLCQGLPREKKAFAGGRDFTKQIADAPETQRPYCATAGTIGQSPPPHPPHLVGASHRPLSPLFKRLSQRGKRLSPPSRAVLMRHKFTLIIPSYNGGDYLKACIAAIQAQTDPDFALAVLDDGSTDGSLEWLAGLDEPRLTVYPAPEHLGIVQNWGRALEIPKAEFMTILGQDDLLDPDYLAVMDALTQGAPGRRAVPRAFSVYQRAGRR